MQKRRVTPGKKGGDEKYRLYQPIDWLFLMFLVLEFLAWPLFPALPLVVALAAMTTRVLSSKWRTIVLWVFAGAATLMVLAPFRVGLVDLSIAEVGPATPASPAA